MTGELKNCVTGDRWAGMAPLAPFPDATGHRSLVTGHAFSEVTGHALSESNQSRLFCTVVCEDHSASMSFGLMP